MVAFPFIDTLLAVGSLQRRRTGSGIRELMAYSRTSRGIAPRHHEGLGVNVHYLIDSDVFVLRPR